jgi:hypothetical protein
MAIQKLRAKPVVHRFEAVNVEISYNTNWKMALPFVVLAAMLL